MATEYLIFGWRSGRGHGLLCDVISLRKLILALAGSLLVAASSATAAPQPKPKTPPQPPKGVQVQQPQHFYAPVFQREMYDNQLSVNDRCAVKHGKLNKSIRPTYVNRQPVGFC